MSVTSLANPSHPGNGGCTALPDGCVAITKSDSATFSDPVSVFVTTSGDLVLTPWNGGSNVTLPAWPAFTLVPFRVKAVLSAGTTASGIFGVY